MYYFIKIYLIYNSVCFVINKVVKTSTSYVENFNVNMLYVNVGPLLCNIYISYVDNLLNKILNLKQ